MEHVKSNYEKVGWVQVANVIPFDFLEVCREELTEVIDTVAASKGLEFGPHDTLNGRFNALCEHDRGLGGMVYDCMRYHPLVQAMAGQKQILEIARQLLAPKLLFHVHDQLQFRIDRKGEDRFQLQWHQDYWYNNTSTQAITVWIPLFDTSLGMGPVQFIDGSHHQTAKVRIDPDFKTDWDQNKLITLAEAIPEESGGCIPCPAGSAVFMNALTMHRSGRNTTESCRFTIVLRYADLFDPELIGKRWKAGISPGNVSLLKQRPDLVANLDELKAKGAFE
jgi:ectoine hydroxylase-related dioxygenase (phytanoyl-CoA dioxygenase family)